MPRFAANLSMMFTEVPFLERFDAAVRAGFDAVEYLFPYSHPEQDVAAALQSAGLTQALFNAPPGDWESGERGLASLTGRDEEFAEGLETAMSYAQALDCSQIHVMAGIPEPQGPGRRTVEQALNHEAAEVYTRRIRQAADRAAAEGRRVVIEPINHVDIPGYFLGSVALGLQMLERIDRENLGLQLDLYHAQITDGDLTRLLRSSAEVIEHIQIASVPDRHEPDAGETSYPHLFSVIDEIGYSGWVGCEYHPVGRTEDGLGWFHALRAGAELPGAELPGAEQSGAEQTGSAQPRSAESRNTQSRKTQP